MVLRFAGLSSPPEALTRCTNCQWAIGLDEYRTGGLKYVSLLPFANESSRRRPVFRAHINNCLSIGLGQFNRPSHMNPGLLHDQGHKTPSLQKAKTHVMLFSPSATQPLLPSACITNIKHTTCQVNPLSQPFIVPNTCPDPSPHSSPTTMPTGRHAHLRSVQLQPLTPIKPP